MTGDETLIDANFLCYYRIVDPVVYAFYVENPHETLRSLFNHEVHAALGRYTLDMLLTSERGKVQTELVSNMRRAVARLPLGVEILNVYMREAHPPIEVVPSYRAVASARESKVEIIHTAHTYVNALLPLSRGEAESKISAAQANASEKISKAAGDTEQFLLKQQIFQQSEAVQRIWLWWNAVESVLRGKTLYIFPKNVQRRFYHSRQPGAGTIPETFRKTSDTNDNPYQQPDRENSAGNMEGKNR